jgi:hypothetical protein
MDAYILSIAVEGKRRGFDVAVINWRGGGGHKLTV